MSDGTIIVGLTQVINFTVTVFVKITFRIYSKISMLFTFRWFFVDIFY